MGAASHDDSTDRRKRDIEDTMRAQNERREEANRRIALAITTAIFTNANKKKGERIILESEFGHELSVLGFNTTVQLIESELNKPR